ncbi:flagellar biosynthetic protein FliO [Salinarimonas rosea]|uniref:flagellar biosynthetic protein FliO n=1 Tax=Salinarimonas rosea TaxID=552063 RepID=UPI000405C8CE|nr:flagellar biosynthetic protein FliO [Salinarimonas rosea]
MLGFENTSIVQYLIAFAVVMGLLALFAWLAPRLMGRRMGGQGLASGRSKQPRLGIVDVYDLDRQRQLVLLRRDGVEHLLLIGGPNDVVVESGIGRAPPRPQQRPGGTQMPMPGQAPAPLPQAAPVPVPHAPAAAEASPEPAPMPSPITPPLPDLAPPLEEPRHPGAGVSDAAVVARAPETVAPEAVAAAAAAPPSPPAAAMHAAPSAPSRAPAVEPRPTPRRPAPEPMAAPEAPAPDVPPPRRSLMDLARAAAGGAPVLPQRSRATPTIPPEPPPRREPHFGQEPRIEDESPASAARFEPRVDEPRIVTDDAPEPAPSPEVPPTPSVDPADQRASRLAAAAPEDAAVLSDMARQLEDALKRPLPPGAQPRRPAGPDAGAFPPPPRPAPKPAREPGAEFDFASLLRRPAGGAAPTPPPPASSPAASPGPAAAPQDRTAAERAAASAALAGFGADEPASPPRVDRQPEQETAPAADAARFDDVPPVGNEPAPFAAFDEPVGEPPPSEEARADDVAAEDVPPEEMPPEEAPPEEIGASPLGLEKAGWQDSEPETIAAEEPATHEPAAEEPIAEEPVAEEPADEQPLDEEPVDEEPSVPEAPVFDAPPFEEPAPDEPIAAAQPEPTPAPTPPPPEERPAAKPIDPFSVEEIEAEFARLLGRAPSRDEKS